MNDDDDDPINRALNIRGTPQPPKVINSTASGVATIVGHIYDDSAVEDFTFARTHTREAIEVATDTMHELAQLAMQSQNPEMFNALSSVLTIVINGGGKLLDAQKKLRDITKPAAQSNGAPQPAQEGNVTNNLFIGSTAELLKIIDGQKTK